MFENALFLHTGIPALLQPTTSGDSVTSDSRLAVDGDVDPVLTSTGCSDSSGSSVAWWQVDLGKVIYVAAVEITGSTCCGELHVHTFEFNAAKLP